VRRIFIDMGALIAGATKGEFEERLKSVVKEVTAAEGDIYSLMIHTPLALGWRGCYGCSKYFETSFGSWRTARYWCNHLDEYQKYFEKDKALERRFQKIIIEEPDTAISILRGIKEKYDTPQSTNKR
jgi:ATP-dependent Clp protease ATP-binding subunit ClpB